jgi:hypothetical protein
MIVGASLSVKPYTALYTSQVLDANIVVSSTNIEGRTESVLDFNSVDGIFSRDFATAFSWPISAGTILYTWQPTLIELPENTYNRSTDWIECGGGTGFVQGILIEADTFNATKVFQLQDSDTLAFHALNEVGTGIAFNKQSVKAFSCIAPFIAHSVRLVTTDSVPWRVFRHDLVFEPLPETTMLWKTELTSMGGVGWQHLREVDFEYISTTPITLTFTVDTGSGSYAPLNVTIPSSGGTQAKLNCEVSPNKWRLLGFSASSSAPFRLFIEGFSCKIRSWGSDGPYRDEKPAGGPSKTGAVV